MKTHLLSALALDLPPFMAKPAKKRRKPVRIGGGVMEIGKTRASQRRRGSEFTSLGLRERKTITRRDMLWLVCCEWAKRRGARDKKGRSRGLEKKNFIVQSQNGISSPGFGRDFKNLLPRHPSVCSPPIGWEMDKIFHFAPLWLCVFSVFLRGGIRALGWDAASAEGTRGEISATGTCM